MGIKVFLGVGHGGSDTGAIANGFYEKNINLSIALACRTELERHGVNVLMSRYKDEDDDINEEIRECNAFAPDVGVDIHNNAGGGDGAEVYYTVTGGFGKTLATNVLNEIVNTTGQNSRGIKTKVNSRGTDYFGFIRSTKAPCIIVECAFVDNANDIKIIDTEAERVLMGEAIAKGILKSLNIVILPKQTATAPTQETTGKLYRVQVGAYRVRENAENMKERLQAAGYDAIIVEGEK